ncbi:lytic transglycosylase domain-containing protein [candidate division KSB1 bacterium]|nr:lytic transglycosylase domain-containing protein [candidate division KSB1 bacterium]
MMHRIENNLKHKLGITLQVTILLLVLITAFGFSYKYFTKDETNEKMMRLERTLQDLRAALHSDSIREYNIQKIMAIMDNFNKTLPSDLKYEIANEIYQMSIKYDNLDVDLICATITHESALTWDPKVKSEAGAMGLMQIMPTTGMYVANYESITWTSPEDVLYNPIYNIRIGCRYLSSLIDYFDDVDAGLAAYNGGQKQAALWLASGKSDGILWAETQHYVPAIMKLYLQYQGLNI